MSQTMTLTITADDRTMERVKRLLALIEYCCRVGHSAYVGTFIDGDGPCQLKTEITDPPYQEPLFEAHQKEISRMESGKEPRTNLTGRIELAHEGGYSLSRYIKPDQTDQR